MSQLITGLPANNPVATTDLMVIEQAAGTRKISIANLLATFVGNAWSLLTTGANNVVPVYAGLASNGVGAGAYTNIDIALTPKGTGALMASTPDNLIPGGNKRGTYAVDWQMQRTLALQAATGNNSVIGGGSNNAAPGSGGVVVGGTTNNSGSSSNNFVGGGSSNVITIGPNAVIAGGSANTMPSSATGSCIGGGTTNVISNANNAVIAGGSNNLVDASNSVIVGGDYGTVRGCFSAEAYSGGRFAVQGDAQRRDVLYRKVTADATPAFIHTDGSASDANGNQVNTPINSAFSFVIELVAKSAANKAAFFEIRGLIQIGATAATAALVGAATGTTALFQDAALTGIAVAITANTSFGGLNIQVTGLAATSIKWVARVRTVEIVG